MPLQVVNLGQKEQFSDWFRAINPLLTKAQRSLVPIDQFEPVLFASVLHPQDSTD